MRRASGAFLAGVLLIVVAALALGACGIDKAVEPFRDAPKLDERNNRPAMIIEMPDGFSNLAGKCDGGNYVYVIYKGDENRGAVSVVPNDPRCTGDK